MIRQRGDLASAGKAQSSGIVRETFRHAAVYSGATVIGRLIGFIMLPFYAPILRDLGYCVIDIFDATLVLLGGLLAYNLYGWANARAC